MLALASQASGATLGPLAPALSRCLSVYAWGRTSEHQCGVELWDQLCPIVVRPTPLLDLLGRDDLVAVAAGKLNSAAVTSSGEALTWGDGRSARLGHGGDDAVASPSRVEALIGRAHVTGVALGDQHSLYLDSAGAVWAVGSNLEGQVGTGAPISELARQQRRALYPVQIEALLQRGRPGARGGGGGGGGRHEAYLRAFAEVHWPQAQPADEHEHWLSRARARHAGGGGAARQSLSSAFVRPAGGGGGSSQYAAGLSGGGGGGGFGGGGGGAPGITSSGLWGIDLERHLHEAGAQPGVVSTPTRVERPLLAGAGWEGPGGGGGSGGASSTSSSGSSSSGGGHRGAAAGSGGRGLECERVIGVDCGRHFSIAVTEAGEVWTWGASFTGALGQRDVSWATAAAPVADSPLADAIAAEGGAVAVAAAGTGAACLTASGKVVLFGGLASPPIMGRASAAAATQEHRDALAAAQRHGFAVAALPAPVKSIAAGQQHLAMTDGERVWVVGRWLDGDGQEAGAAPFWAPAELLHLPAEGIRKVVAGPHSTGAVSGDGRLFMGGRLLDRHHAEALMQKHGAVLPPGAIDWTWPGFGGAAMAPVPRLPGVVDAALGGWHALVLAE